MWWKAQSHTEQFGLQHACGIHQRIRACGHRLAHTELRQGVFAMRDVAHQKQQPIGGQLSGAFLTMKHRLAEHQHHVVLEGRVETEQRLHGLEQAGAHRQREIGQVLERLFQLSDPARGTASVIFAVRAPGYHTARGGGTSREGGL